MKKIDKNYFLIILISCAMLIGLKHYNVFFASKIDYINQHVAFLSYFRELFHSSHTIFPSLAFNLGAGENLYNFSYYGLYNPLFIPFYFTSKLNPLYYMQFINILVYISIGVLSYKFFKLETNKKSSLYASVFMLLSSSILFHIHRHYMFICYLPFLLIALILINKYFKNGKYMLLILMNTFILLSSFYYSVSCFLVEFVYFTYLYLKNNKKFILKDYIFKSLRFILYLFISVMLTVFYLFPSFIAILGNREAGKSTFDLFSFLMPNLIIKNLMYDNYGVGLSIISYLAIIYNLRNKDLSKKVLSIMLSLILILPIFMYILNGTLYIRSKILIPFIPLIVMFLGMFVEQIDKVSISKKKYFVGCLIVFIYNLVFFRNYYLLVFIVDSVLTYLIICNKNKKKYLIILIIFLFMVNLGISYTETFLTRKYYNIGNYNELVDKIIKEDKEVYRIKNLDGRLRNVNNIFNKRHYTTSVYSSVENKYYKDFLRKEFNVSVGNKNKLMLTNNSNILFDSFFGNRYVIQDKNISKNENARSIIYATENNYNIDQYNKVKYPYNLEYLFNGVVTTDKTNSSIENVIRKENISINIDNKNIKYKDGKYYINSKKSFEFEIPNSYRDKIVIINFDVNNSEKVRYIKVDNAINMVSMNTKDYFYGNDNNTFNYVLYNTSDSYKIKVSGGKFIISNINVYTMDYSKYLKLNNNIVNAKLDYKKTYGDYIYANINVDNDSYLATTIPYDDNFKIYIDGKESKIIKVNKAFLGTLINSGSHEIKIVYKNKYLFFGQAVSLISLILLVIFYVSEKYVRKSLEKKVNLGINNGKKV